MENIEQFLNTQKPTALRPLLGMTVLLVEDSLSTCEAVRLMCLRSGARIRRADCLESARRHLGAYRPSVILVDMGLPDGSGADLIADVARASPRIEVILGISGDPEVEDMAMQAGADGFIVKPLASLAAFQAEILAHFPRDQRPKGPRRVDDAPIPTDPLALQDDLAHAVNLLQDGDETPDTHRYLATFLAGVARTASDQELQNVAGIFAQARSMAGPEKRKLVQTLQDRLIEPRTATYNAGGTGI